MGNTVHRDGIRCYRYGAVLIPDKHYSWAQLLPTATANMETILQDEAARINGGV